MLVKRGKSDGTGILFLHGYGANAEDLFPLAAELAWSDRESWYFPDAPLEIPLGPHMVGRAWFPIPLRELQEGVDFSNSTPPGLEKAATHVKNLIAQMPHQKIILGGFSQGAMLATHLVLSNPTAYKGLAILSGTMIHSSVWRKLAEKASGLEFFQSHGEDDPVLPIAGAQKLNTMLVECGLQGELKTFRGGHEIPGTVLRDLKFYLRNHA
jgi:phospholipase/carboxylesterase